MKKKEFDWDAYYANHGPYDVEVDLYFVPDDKLCVRLKRDGQQQIFLYDVDIDEAIKALHNAKAQALELRAKYERKGKMVSYKSGRKSQFPQPTMVEKGHL